MSLTRRWSEAAKRHLEEIGWHPAEVVDAAVQRFAATGRGDVERFGDSGRFVLRVGPYRAWFRIAVEGDETLMYVTAVFGPRRKVVSLL
jgi:plasmid stabilization system protein ParE